MRLAIEARALTRRFGDHVAVEGVDLRVEEGDLFGFLGLNGAGKTTTIRMLCTLLAPTSGRAIVAGHDVAEDPLAVRASIGLVGDADARLARPGWSGREYLAYFADVQRLGVDVEECLGVAGIPREARSRPVKEYSTGMSRRLEIARALLPRPRILFLDEPTRGLDLPAKRETWDLLERLAREERVTIFLSSHELAEIEAVCRSLTVMARGRLTFAGSLADLPRGEKLEEALIRLLRGASA